MSNETNTLTCSLHIIALEDVNQINNFLEKIEEPPLSMTKDFFKDILDRVNKPLTIVCEKIM